MKKISLIGAGNIGGILASLISSKNLGNVVLLDIVEGVAKGKALDINQSNAVSNSSIEIKGSNEFSDIKKSDVIIVTAGVARKPGMSRDDLIETNFKIMSKIGKAIREFSPDAFIICITNPLDAMAWTLKKVGNINKNMIVGMAGILDSARFKFFLSQEINVSMENISTMVLGGHGDTMVPLINSTSISGIPLSYFINSGLITQKKVDDIILRTRNGGGEIVSLMKNSSAFFAPAASGIEIAESYLKNQKKLLPCSAYLDSEYNCEDIFLGVPVIVGKKGVEKILEIDFDEKEAQNFKKSINSVRELTMKCKKLLV